jgi:uncharacterized membrane protein (UPF0136 family)
MATDQLPDDHDPETLMAAALDDWWITTDPIQPFHAPAVARHLDSYLASYGYTIALTRPAPSRTSIAGNLLLGTACAIAAALAAHHSAWGWALTGTVVTTLLIHEAVRDFTGRLDTRHGQ